MAIAIFPYRSSTMGQGSTPTNEHALVRTPNGRALAKGWPDDFSGTTQSAATNQYCGYRLGFSGLYEPVLYWKVPETRIRRGSRVLGWTMMCAIEASVFASNVVPNGSIAIKLWAIRRTLAAGLSGLTWSNYIAGGGNTWDELGVRFGIGNDTDAVELATITWTQADHNLTPLAGSPVYKAVELREEAQFLLNHNLPWQLIFQPTWTKPASGDSYLLISTPADAPNVQHTYWIAKTREGLEYFMLSGSRLDRLHMLAADAASKDQHMYLGTPSRGASSQTYVWGLANEKDDSQVAVCTISDAMTQVGPVNRQGVAGSGWMRCVRPFDTASGQTNRTCTLKITFTSSTAYVLSYQDEGASGFVTTGLTDAGVGAIGTTKTFQISGANFVTIHSTTDGNFGGTFAADDVLTIEMRADGSDSGHPAASLDDVWLAPHLLDSRLEADSVKARPARWATVQQAFRYDTSNIEDAVDDTDSPVAAPGVIARVDHGDGIRIHVKVSDPQRFRDNQWVTIAHYNAKDVTGLSGRVLHGHIKTRYALDHATWPGQIELFEDDTDLVTDFPNEATVVCSGVWHGELFAPARGYLAAPTSTSSNRLSLTKALPREEGTLRITNTLTGDSELLTINHLESTDVVLNSNPSRIYPVDSEITFDDDDENWNPIHVFATPGASAEIKRKQGFVAAISFARV